MLFLKVGYTLRPVSGIFGGGCGNWLIGGGEMMMLGLLAMASSDNDASMSVVWVDCSAATFQSARSCGTAGILLVRSAVWRRIHIFHLCLSPHLCPFLSVKLLNDLLLELFDSNSSLLELKLVQLFKLCLGLDSLSAGNVAQLFYREIWVDLTK